MHSIFPTQKTLMDNENSVLESALHITRLWEVQAYCLMKVLRRPEVWLFVPKLDSWKFAWGSLIQDCFKLGSSASYRPSLMQFCLCYRKEDHLPSSSSPHLESSTSLKDLLPNFSLLALLFLCAIFCNICIFEKTIWLLLTQKRFSSQDSHYGS